MDADDAHDQLQRIEEARDKLNDAASGDPTNLHAILRLQEVATLTMIAPLREIRRSFTAADTPKVDAMPEEYAAARYIATKYADAEEAQARRGEKPLDAPGPNEYTWARSVLLRLSE